MIARAHCRLVICVGDLKQIHCTSAHNFILKSSHHVRYAAIFDKGYGQHVNVQLSAAAVLNRHINYVVYFANHMV